LSPLLSVVVPLPTVQSSLDAWAERLLECAAELAPRFEVLLVAESASELALESAQELARRYPQIRVVESRRTPGTTAATGQGVPAARGKTVLVIDAAVAVSPSRLRELWGRQQDEWRRLTGAASALEASTPGWLRRLLEWGQQLREQAPLQGGSMVRADDAPSRDLSTEDVEQLILEYRRDAAHAQPPAAKGISFLQHLRNLAIGE
jgi:glycosyltransferase involved in cell wall biosynthesis